MLQAGDGLVHALRRRAAHEPQHAPLRVHATMALSLELRKRDLEPLRLALEAEQVLRQSTHTEQTQRRVGGESGGRRPRGRGGRCATAGGTRGMLRQAYYPAWRYGGHVVNVAVKRAIRVPAQRSRMAEEQGSSRTRHSIGTGTLVYYRPTRCTCTIVYISTILIVGPEPGWRACAWCTLRYVLLLLLFALTGV